MTKNLTVGSPLKCILFFSFPVYLGMLFQQFYNIVDTMIVGRLLGVDALAGVGSTGAFNFMVLGFCNGLCSGFSIPIARAFGAREDGVLRRYVSNSIFLSLCFSLLITVVVCISCHRILILMHTPANIFEYAFSYIFVIFLGIPFTVFYNLEAGILRALGDSKSPVLFLVFSSVLNIITDLLLICVFKRNVDGAAIATVFSQAVACLLCYHYIRKKFSILKMNAEDRKPSFSFMAELCRSGVPMGLQYSVTAIGSIIIQGSMNSLGSAAVAGVTAAQKLHSFIACPLEALGASMAPYTGQNIGARKPDRVKAGTLTASVCGFILSAVIAGIIFLFGEALIGLFLDQPDEEVISYATQFLFAISICYPLLTLVNVVRFSIQGMGYSFIAILSGVMELIARAVVGLFLAPRFGFPALCIAHPLAWVFADIFLIPTYFICLRQSKKRIIC